MAGTWGGRPGSRVRAVVFSEESHCWVCGEWVNQELPPSHPMGRTVDHVQERHLGGAELDRQNCRLAHRRCNTRKSNRVRHGPPVRYSVDVGDL